MNDIISNYLELKEKHSYQKLTQQEEIQFQKYHKIIDGNFMKWSQDACVEAIDIF